jgi:hypothetical protein
VKSPRHPRYQLGISGTVQNLTIREVDYFDFL